jgi:hypothetical protein
VKGSLWYIAEPIEVFCDLDSGRALFYALNKLRRGWERLGVRRAHVYESSLGKYHLIVILKKPETALHRATFALWLGSDRIRAVYTLERIARGLNAPDLLIAKDIYHRGWDHSCQCREKHKFRRITNNCPVMLKLHGKESGAEYYPRRRDRFPRVRASVKFGAIKSPQVLETWFSRYSVFDPDKWVEIMAEERKRKNEQQ